MGDPVVTGGTSAMDLPGALVAAAASLAALGSRIARALAAKSGG